MEVRDELVAKVEHNLDLLGSLVEAVEVDNFEHDVWEPGKGSKGSVICPFCRQHERSLISRGRMGRRQG